MRCLVLCMLDRVSGLLGEPPGLTTRISALRSMVTRYISSTSFTASRKACSRSPANAFTISPFLFSTTFRMKSTLASRAASVMSQCTGLFSRTPVRLRVKKHGVVLFDGFFSADCWENAFSSSAVACVVVEANVAQEALLRLLRRRRGLCRFCCYSFGCAYVDQVVGLQSWLMCFYAFYCFSAEHVGGFFWLNWAVCSASEDYCDVFVFYACKIQFCEYGQEHDFAWCFACGVVYDDGDFAFGGGDFA